MRIRKLTCAALCLLLVCAAIGGAYADDTPKGYYKMWSDQSNTVTIDGVTYYDVYGDRKVRPDVTNTSGDAGFFKDVLKNKKSRRAAACPRSKSGERFPIVSPIPIRQPS